MNTKICTLKSSTKTFENHWASKSRGKGLSKTEQLGILSSACNLKNLETKAGGLLEAMSSGSAWEHKSPLRN